MQELIINDDDFIGFSQSIQYLTQSMEACYTAIINKLRTVCDDGVTEGTFNENLKAYVSALEMMQGQLQFVTEELDRIAKEFISEIDEIDGEIY